jgi:hypothetical protein
MKRHWLVRRQFKPYLDGTQRWDRAYQLLLQWANTTQPVILLPPPPNSQTTREVDYASSGLCPGLDPTSSREPDD